MTILWGILLVIVILAMLPYALPALIGLLMCLCAAIVGVILCVVAVLARVRDAFRSLFRRSI